MAPTEEFGQRRLGVVDPMPWRYEVMRPLVLFGERTATQRAHDTQTPPATVRTLTRRFRQQGRGGLLPSGHRQGSQRRAPRRRAAVRQEVDRLQALSPGFPYRALARLLSYKCETPSKEKTATRLWMRSAVAPHGPLPRGPYPTPPERTHARWPVMALAAPGWDKRSLSRFWPVSRPTRDAWIARWETAHAARLPPAKAPS